MNKVFSCQATPDDKLTVSKCDDGNFEFTIHQTGSRFGAEVLLSAEQAADLAEYLVPQHGAIDSQQASLQLASLEQLESEILRRQMLKGLAYSTTARHGYPRFETVELTIRPNVQKSELLLFATQFEVLLSGKDLAYVAEFAKLCLK